MIQQPRTWLNTQTEHEGFPIYSRRPNVRVDEFEVLRPGYPTLLTITHVLTHVKQNGLPEAEYNESLEELDSAIIAPFRDETNGLIAVVETFAGKRTYYVYLTQLFDPEAYMHEVRIRFPHEDLSCEQRADPTWRLFNGYARDFQFA